MFSARPVLGDIFFRIELFENMKHVVKIGEQNGDVDVLITDGFTGNIFLKTAEGIASLILDRFGSLLPPEEYQKLKPQIHDLSGHLHYAEYPGAILAGVQGIVIKCHGYSTPRAFLNAVRGAVQLVRGDQIIP